MVVAAIPDYTNGFENDVPVRVLLTIPEVYSARRNHFPYKLNGKQSVTSDQNSKNEEPDVPVM